LRERGGGEGLSAGGNKNKTHATNIVIGKKSKKK